MKSNRRKDYKPQILGSNKIKFVLLFEQSFIISFYYANINHYKKLVKK